MRPRSSPSDLADGTEPPGLFDEILARGPVRPAVSDRAWLAALIEAEVALATAQADLGLIPAEAAAAIAAAGAAGQFDPAALARDAAATGNPVLPLVRAMRAAVPERLAHFVHHAATSQDILDTATMLVCHRALGGLLDDLAGAADAAAELARRHRDTAMAGRTLLQQAMPVTFGLKAAGWLVGLDQAAARLADVRDGRLAVQLGGATGTLDGFGDSALALLAGYAAATGLAAPVLPWHTDRTRIGELAGALAGSAGVIGKVAKDVTLLAQSEVGEVAEAAPGDSSAMPHKRNPVAAVSAVACAAQAPGLAAILYTAMVGEHERAAGGWQAEWRPLRELLVSVGSAAAWLRECLAGLTVDEAALRANLAMLAATAGLADPAGRLGAAGMLVDRALAAHAAGWSGGGGPS